MVENSTQGSNPNAQPAQDQRRINQIRDVEEPKTGWGRFWYKIGNTLHKAERAADNLSEVKHPYLISVGSAIVLGLAVFGAYNLVSGRDKGISEPEFLEYVESLRGLERKQFYDEFERYVTEKKRELSVSK